MKNPFLEEGYLNLNASINKLVIAEVPEGISIDHGIEGKSALDIFSTKLIIEEIKQNHRQLKIDIDNIEEKRLPQYLDDCLESDDISVNKCAHKIIRLFGERLGIILLTLKQCRKENRQMRKDWNDEQWDYWGQLENVILAGGLASSKIGENFKYYIEEIFKEADEKCYKIILNKDSSNIAIRGCASYIKDADCEKSYIILDCGQSFIKRSIVEFNSHKIRGISKLDKISSAYVDWDFKDEDEEKAEALKLSEFLVDVIFKTIEEAEMKGKIIGDEITISIANYVKKGAFADRGGYGKLRLISSNYEECLAEKLFEIFHRIFKIKLIHDGTAMAAAFADYSNAVCISLGTAFGVGFPQKIDK